MTSYFLGYAGFVAVSSEVNLILLTMGLGDGYVGPVGCWGLKRSQKRRRRGGIKE